MKSRTKNRLTEQKIRELVRVHFGEECGISDIEELKGGMFNAIYRITRTKEQDKIVLKVGVVPGTPLLTYERDIMPVEVFVRQVDGEWRIAGIIDLERAFWGDPVGDFPTSFVFTDDIRKEPAFLNAYLKAAGKSVYTEAAAKRYQLYRLYILTVMAAEVFRYDFLYAKLQGAWAGRNISKCLKELL